MKQLAERILTSPFVAHWRRAIERFGERLGAQSAAAITYFSVLALVPVLMVAFATAGWTVTVLRPDLLSQFKELIASQLAEAGAARGTVSRLVDQAAGSWQAVGVVGLASALWAGAGWIANLKSAVRLQLRAETDIPERKAKPWIEVPVNIGILIGLVFFMMLSFGLAGGATSLADTVTGAFGWRGGWAMAAWRGIGVLASLVAAFGLFLFLFTVFPQERIRWRDRLRGALVGALATTALQSLTGVLFGVFSGNAAAAVFGPVITLMLFFNLFAQVIIVVAAWLGTAEAPVEPEPAATEPTLTDVDAAPLAAAVVAARTPRRASAATSFLAGVGLGALAAAWVSGVRSGRDPRAPRGAARSRRASR